MKWTWRQVKRWISKKPRSRSDARVIRSAKGPIKFNFGVVISKYATTTILTLFPKTSGTTLSVTGILTLGSRRRSLWLEVTGELQFQARRLTVSIERIKLSM